MPEPSKPKLFKKPRPPSPQNHNIFDSWNSSSTGHQRSESRDNAGTWRDIRSDKLARQFRDGHCDDSSGPPMAFDGTCGSSPETKKGEWKWVSDAEAKREKLGVQDIRSFMGVGKRKAPEIGNGKAEKEKEKEKRVKVDADKEAFTSAAASTAPSTSSLDTGTAEPTNLLEKSTLFAGITVYINGSTLPQISDYKLKRLLVSHGAKVSIAMARKSVSHVIIGQPGTTASGAGGGLAARKLQQEIERGGWKGVRVVGVDWAIESIKAGKRLAESRFAPLSIAPKGQRSVVGMFSR
ncbi:uncharacterized protein N7498_000442 [Penicillium cinerascens]|uniref:BRCT domain-containing protein n=1 Tax=Penicillium cinerascens TaxID=70096 RepID=A0A9W9TD44_9EURO|nr:uncharacterized protein N7498_000442 [Penicillium cinerascens]KAJ5218343.1 hypothetical protein N7498_000442 [Penicillium cinerascens]